MKCSSPSAIALLLASLLCAACSEPIRPSAEEQALFSAVDAAIASGDPQVDQVVSAFGLPVDCLPDGCRFQADAHSQPSLGRGVLSINEQGFFFSLPDLSRTCIRTAAVRNHYDMEAPEQSCSDGECWGTAARRPWGIIYFDLDGPDDKCVTGMGINTR